jgi:acyl-CoA thioester hydrolase
MSDADFEALRVTYRGTVYPTHLDHMGHMNVQHYVGMFDAGVWNLFSAIGLTAAYLRDQRRTLAAAEMHIAYRRELFAGDVVEVRSGLLRVGRSSLHIVHEMRDAVTGDLAALQRAVAVHLDAGARRAEALPPAVVEAATAHLVDYPADELP